MFTGLVSRSKFSRSMFSMSVDEYKFYHSKYKPILRLVKKKQIFLDADKDFDVIRFLPFNSIFKTSFDGLVNHATSNHNAENTKNLIENLIKDLSESNFQYFPSHATKLLNFIKSKPELTEFRKTDVFLMLEIMSAHNHILPKRILTKYVKEHKINTRLLLDVLENNGSLPKLMTQLQKNSKHTNNITTKILKEKGLLVPLRGDALEVLNEFDDIKKMWETCDGLNVTEELRNKTLRLIDATLTDYFYSLNNTKLRSLVYMIAMNGSCKKWYKSVRPEGYDNLLNLCKIYDDFEELSADDVGKWLNSIESAMGYCKNQSY